MEHIKEIREIWAKQPETFPVFLEENPKIFEKADAAQKRENEELIEELSWKMRKKAQQRPEDEKARVQWEGELEQEWKDFLGREKILCLSEWMSGELLDAFERETKNFVGKIRKFDETLEPEQIWQAMRNYFIYAMIVEMQGEEQNAGDPILAYSLLYPYTDNYIDDGEIPGEEKARYNRMIGQKLKGEAAEPGNCLEEKTCRLLDMILGAYEGEAKNKVAYVLLQLLEAQSRSIGQMKEDIDEEQILEISIWKGGSSVLADYLFATADWREREEEFYLKFGFMLQLVDDLQDMEEDGRAGSRTLMTNAAGEKRLEEQINRLLWFIWNEISAYAPKNPDLKDFVLKNCVGISMLSAVAVGSSGGGARRNFLSKEYIKALEPYLPVSAEFIKRMKIQKKREQYAGFRDKSEVK